MSDKEEYITVSIPYIRCVGTQEDINRNHAQAALEGWNFCAQCGKYLK